MFSTGGDDRGACRFGVGGTATAPERESRRRALAGVVGPCCAIVLTSSPGSASRPRRWLSGEARFETSQLHLLPASVRHPYRDYSKDFGSSTNRHRIEPH